MAHPGDGLGSSNGTIGHSVGGQFSRSHEDSYADQGTTNTGFTGQPVHYQHHHTPADPLSDGNYTTQHPSHGPFTPPPEPSDQNHPDVLQSLHQLPLAQALHHAHVCQASLDGIIRQLVQELVQLKQAVPQLLQTNTDITHRLQYAEARLAALSTDKGLRQTKAAFARKLAEARNQAAGLQQARDLLQAELNRTRALVAEKDQALVAKDRMIEQLQTGEIKVDPTTARILALNAAVQKATMENEHSATSENAELRAKLLSSDRARQRLRNENDLFRTQLTSLEAGREFPRKKKQPRHRILDVKVENPATKGYVQQDQGVAMPLVKEEPGFDG